MWVIMGHFILRAVPLKIVMTGTHSPFSFLIDCHFLVLAILPADLNDSLIMWWEFVRELSESHEIELGVMLRDLCRESVCVWVHYIVLETLSLSCWLLRIKKAVKDPHVQEAGRLVPFQQKAHICKAKAEWHNGHLWVMVVIEAESYGSKSHVTFFFF